MVSAAEVTFLSHFRRAFSKSEERVQTLKLIWETRRISLEPIADFRPPTNSPSRSQTHLSTTTLPVPYKVEPGNTWSESDLQGAMLTTPSPGGPSASHEERSIRYGGSSISSGSSTFSSGSPYTPTLQPHATHSHPHQFDRSRSGPSDLSQPSFYYQLSPDSTSSHEHYYQNMNFLTAPHPEAVSAPATYVGSDGQLNILSPVRLMATMGPDFRQYPSYTASHS